MNVDEPKRIVRSVLVVDDDPTFLEATRRALQRLGKRVIIANDAPTAIGLARSHRPDLALVDLRMPWPDGIWAVQQLRMLDTTIYIVLYSGDLTPAHVVAAMRAGANDCLEKDLGAQNVLYRIEHDRSPPPGRAGETTLEQTKRNRVSRALVDSNECRTEAAARLGITRAGLQGILRKWQGRPH